MRSGGLCRCGLSLRPFLESFPFLSPGSSWCLGYVGLLSMATKYRGPQLRGQGVGQVLKSRADLLLP